MRTSISLSLLPLQMLITFDCTFVPHSTNSERSFLPGAKVAHLLAIDSPRHHVSKSVVALESTRVELDSPVVARVRLPRAVHSFISQLLTDAVLYGMAVQGVYQAAWLVELIRLVEIVRLQRLFSLLHLQLLCLLAVSLVFQESSLAVSLSVHPLLAADNLSEGVRKNDGHVDEDEHGHEGNIGPAHIVLRLLAIDKVREHEKVVGRHHVQPLVEQLLPILKSAFQRLYYAYVH